MSKRILLAVVIAVIMCSCAFGETWTEKAGQWSSGAWQRTKDFFTGDIPAWFRDWRNNSDSKKLDRLTEEVASLRRDIARLSGRVSASGFEDSSRSADLTKREQELDRLSRDIAAQREDLHERRREIDAQLAELSAREQELDKLRQDIAAQRDALQERSNDIAAQAEALQASADHVTEFTRKYQEAEEKAAKIHARLSADEHISKFIASGMLAKIDIERFMLYDRSYGAVNIPGTPYGTLTANLDTDKFGFIDTGTLKASLKSLFRDNTLSLRGDSAVVLVREDNKSSWNRQIDSVSDRAFFTLEGLTSELEGLSPAPDKSEAEIAAFLKVNDQRGRLRIFFRTRHEGLYVLALMDNENAKPVIYLAGDDTHKLISKGALPRELRRSTELLNSGREAALYFDSEDSKIDVYLDRFVKGLVDKIPGYKE